MSDQTFHSDAQRIAALEARLAWLEARLGASPEPGLDASLLGRTQTSRRQALQRLVLVAAGGSAAVAMAGSRTAAAVDSSLLLGVESNDATDVTRVDVDTAEAAAAFVVQAVHGATVPPLANADAEYRAALAGWSISPTQPHGVFGYARESTGAGVVGVGKIAGVVADGDTGVMATGGAVGVSATASTPTTGVGVRASGPTGAVVSGGTTALRLSAADQVLLALSPDRASDATKRVAPPSRTTTHVRGMVDLDASYDLWLCVADGSPGTWRKISGPGTAGAFHAVTPGRVFDSRLAMPGPATPMSLGTTRTVSVAGRRDVTTGEVLQTDFVPAGATAIACNVTVVSTTGSGFLVGNPGGVTTIGASTINWSTSGQILNNGVILTLNASRELTFVAGGSSGSSAHVVVDVTGYYR